MSAAGSDLIIRDYAPALATHFRDINAEWINAMYVMEAADLAALDNPQAILDGGGAILFVEAAGLGIVGTVALRQTAPGIFELTKMGVLEKARGRKAGEYLLHAAIARAQDMGATTLYLLSNRKSAAAIHLYEKAGFAHDDDIMRAYGARYERCNVAMLYTGKKP